MKKVIYSVLLFAGVGFALAACNNGDYNANPASNANNSVNPLAPLDSAQLAAFVTTGTPSFITATINGSSWSANGDTAASWYFVDTTGCNLITGISGGKFFQLQLRNVYATNIYNMGHNNRVTYGIVADYGDTTGEKNIHISYFGNSGEVQILQNNPVAMKGTFYFQAIDSATGDVVNVYNGYFNVLKF